MKLAALMLFLAQFSVAAGTSLVGQPPLSDVTGSTVSVRCLALDGVTYESCAGSGGAAGGVGATKTTSTDTYITGASGALFVKSTDTVITASVLPTGAATETTLNGVKTGTDRIPAQGQALAAGSLPVVMTAAQVTTLTPPAALTNFANETGGNLAAIKTDVDKIPAQGQALAAASLPVVLTAIQQTALTPPAAITGFALETGGNLATIVTNTNKIPTSPATDRATAAAPFSCRLSDGSAFYAGATETTLTSLNGKVTACNTGAVVLAAGVAQAGTVHGSSVTISAPNGNTTAIPVSLASVPSHAVTNAGTFATQATIQAGAAQVGTVHGSSVTINTPNGNTTALPMSLATLPVAPANAGVDIGNVGIKAAQTLATVTTVGAVTAITNALPTGTNNVGTVHGSSVTIQAPNGNTTAIPTSLASLPALAAGSALVGKVGIDQTTPGTTNRVDATIAAAQTIANVTTLGTLTNALPAGSNTIGNVVPTISSITVYNVAGSTMAVNVSSNNITMTGGQLLPVGPYGFSVVPTIDFPLQRLQEEQIVLLREISARLLYLMDAAGRGYGSGDRTEGKENK